MVKGTYHRQDENICQHGCPLYAQQPQGQRHCWDRKAPNSVILLSEHISRRNESEKDTIFEPSFLKEILPLATLPSEIKLRYVCTATACDMMSYTAQSAGDPSQVEIMHTLGEQACGAVVELSPGGYAAM